MENNDELYDRQIRLWGESFQSQLHIAQILVVGKSSLFEDIVKNLLLTGIKQLDICIDIDNDFNGFIINNDSVKENIKNIFGVEVNVLHIEEILKSIKRYDAVCITELTLIGLDSMLYKYFRLEVPVYISYIAGLVGYCVRIYRPQCANPRADNIKLCDMLDGELFCKGKNEKILTDLLRIYVKTAIKLKRELNEDDIRNLNEFTEIEIDPKSGLSLNDFFKLSIPTNCVLGGYLSKEVINDIGNQYKTNLNYFLFYTPTCDGWLLKLKL